MLDKSGILTWLGTDFGPLLLVPGEHLSSWEGIDPPSAGRHVEANFRWHDPNDPATDYDRACDVNDYLGSIEIGAGKGLVLGDMPMSTAWLPSGSLGNEENLAPGGMLVRWMYAESEEEVLRLLTEIPDSVWKAEDFVFEVGPKPLYLFGSAEAGHDVRPDECLMIHLPPGKYSVATALYEPDERTALVLHKLHRLTPHAGGQPDQVLQ